MPTTTPRPASAWPPSFCQTPLLPLSRQKSTGFLSSVSFRGMSLATDSTPGALASLLAWAGERLAVKPFSATA